MVAVAAEPVWGGRAHGEIRPEKKIETEKNKKKTERATLQPHKWLIGKVAARSARPPAAAATATATLGGQVWLGQPLLCYIQYLLLLLSLSLDYRSSFSMRRENLAQLQYT